MVKLLGILGAVRLIVWLSMTWSLISLIIVGFPYWGGDAPSPPIAWKLADSAGYFAVILVVLLLHIMALRVISSSTTSKQATRILVSATGGVFLIAFLTGFTVGLYILPSGILLLIASLLFLIRF